MSDLIPECFDQKDTKLLSKCHLKKKVRSGKSALASAFHFQSWS